MRFAKCMAALGVAAVALAQGPEGQRREGPRVDMVFAALDTDGDGVVSADEIKKATASLKKLDKNNDGKLTEDELRPNFGPGGPGGRGGPGEAGGARQEDLTETLMAYDKNGDGKLTKDELPERMQGLFARYDTDHDGVLTREELQKATAAQRAPGEGGMAARQGGPGGPGGRGGMPGGMMRFSPILAALDADHDGTISAEELANAPAALKQLDKNGDGTLTQDEVRPSFGPREGQRDGQRERRPEARENQLI